MSTSLEKDLHSVYIDGEMPKNFLSQYESLLSSNPKEKAILEKMSSLHSLLQEDSNSKTVSKNFADESFERLQTKMHYAKNISLAEKQKSYITPFAKYAASFMASAAVFAFVFIPVHYKSLSNAKETAVAAISIMKQDGIEPIAKKDVIVDGNIKKEDLSKGLAVSDTQIAKKEDVTANSQASLPVEQKTVSATSLASYGSAQNLSNHNRIGRQFRERLTSVDPFIPDFSSSSITISVPNFHEIGNNMEIMDFPNETGN